MPDPVEKALTKLALAKIQDGGFIGDSGEWDTIATGYQSALARAERAEAKIKTLENDIILTLEDENRGLRARVAELGAECARKDEALKQMPCECGYLYGEECSGICAWSIAKTALSPDSGWLKRKLAEEIEPWRKALQRAVRWMFYSDGKGNADNYTPAIEKQFQTDYKLVTDLLGRQGMGRKENL